MNTSITTPTAFSKKLVLLLKLRPPVTATGDAERIEILVTLPAEPHVASHPPHIEDDEPTWEDAEWQ